jgi:potassium efflux system protein
MNAFRFFLFVLLLTAVPSVSSSSPKETNSVSATIASDVDQIAVRREVLRREKESLEKLKSEVEVEKNEREGKLRQLQGELLTETAIEEARLAMESTRVDLQSARLDLVNEQQKVQSLQTQLAETQRRLEALAGKKEKADQVQLADLQKQSTETSSLLSLAQQHAEQLSTRIALLQKKADLAESWWQSAQAVYQQQQKFRHQESFEELKHRLQEEEQKVQAESSRLQKELASLNGDTSEAAERRELLQKQIEALDESLNILKSQMNIQGMKGDFNSLNLTNLSSFSTEELHTDIEKLKQLADQVEPMVTLTSGKLSVLQQQWSLLQKKFALKNISEDSFQKEKKIQTGLIEQYNTLLETQQFFEKQIRENLEQVERIYGENIQLSLTARQVLPHGLESWESLLAEFTDLPKNLRAIFIHSFRQVTSGWAQANLGRKILFAGLCLALVLLTFGLGRISVRTKDVQGGELRFSAKARTVLLSLLRRSRFSILFGGALLVAGKIFHLEPSVFRVLLLFVVICFGVQLTVKTSYWIFVSPFIPPSHRQPRLHHTVIWATGFSAFFTLLVGLGNLGIFSVQLRNVIDRLFMVLLLLVVYFFLRLRAVLITGIHPDKKTKFWVHLVAMASFSIPLAAFSAAIIGLAGYINLAWFVAGQLALFLAMIIVWMVVRDLVKDLVRSWKLRIEKKAQKHALPSSMIITSLERVIDLVLFLAALWGLSWLYGWGTGTAVDSFLKIWLNYPLFHMGQQVITPIHITTTALLLVFFVYLSSLARHITFAWLYSNVRDRGLRNSLSVFTQYGILIIGSLIALNTLGIKLTSLTVFAGALGVGIGFGLQTIANNLISGMILLAERPVRVEDWVTVGENQGVVSRIGLRSLTLTTWDNQDVIIPNAQLITAPVTNWTLTDDLLRTVFLVGVRYQNDPHQAKDVILEAVSMVPEVSLERPPKVFLTEFANSSVNFKVVFYSQISGQHSRLEAQSKVMFAIWDGLKDADIGIPFPQQDIYIKELPKGAAAELLGESGKNEQLLDDRINAE